MMQDNKSDKQMNGDSTNTKRDGTNRIKRRLATYATVAAAANLGLTDSANGDVIYDDIDDVVILEDSVGTGVVVGFDLDSNGTVDLNFGHQQPTPGIGAAVAFVPESRLDTNAIIATGSGLDANGVGDAFYIRNLASSTRVNGSLSPWAKPQFDATNSRGDLGYLAFGANVSSCPDCEFPSGTEGYIGVQFDAEGTTTYGWVRVSVDGPLNAITVHSLAYDNMGGGVHVPEPGGLGLLAIGGLGVSAMRRRKKSAAAGVSGA